MAGVVLEKRSCPRVNLTANGMLVYREVKYSARLENISLTGALVTLHEADCPSISPGERCLLELQHGGSVDALRFMTRMVHFDSDMACVRFVNLDQDTRLRLRSVIARQMPERTPGPARFPVPEVAPTTPPLGRMQGKRPMAGWLRILAVHDLEPN